MSSPMVRAILEGRKTQTRRVIRHPEKLEGLMLPGEEGEWCPYGGPGDRLWVRETWQHEDGNCDDPKCGNRDHIYYRATDPAPETFASWRPSICMPRWASRIELEVTEVRVQRVQEISEKDAWQEGIGVYSQGSKSLAAIGAGMIYANPTMYRRGFLEGLLALGIWRKLPEGSVFPKSHRGAYAALWDSINAKRGRSWAANQFCWAITFRRVT